MHSFPTSCSFPLHSSLDYLAVVIHVLAHALTTRLRFPTVSNSPQSVAILYSGSPLLPSELPLLIGVSGPHLILVPQPKRLFRIRIGKYTYIAH